MLCVVPWAASRGRCPEAVTPLSAVLLQAPEVAAERRVAAMARAPHAATAVSLQVHESRMPQSAVLPQRPGHCDQYGEALTCNGESITNQLVMVLVLVR